MTLDELIDAVRTATKPDATPEQRAAGAEACRLILTALSSTPGEPMASSQATNSGQIATMIGMLRNIPPDQLLDLAISKLRAALPEGAEVPAVQPLRFHIVQLPRSRT